MTDLAALTPQPLPDPDTREFWDSLRGDASTRQVPDARLALVTAGGGPYGGAVVYSAERP